MGCSSSRSKTFFPDEEILIEESELLFNFSMLHPKHLIELFTSYSVNSQISESNLQIALSDLFSSPNMSMQIYSKFLFRGSYSLKKLNTLAILLGTCRFPSRLKMLFTNYDTTQPEYLYKADIELMISHIIYIFLIVLPQICINSHQSNLKLQKYSEKFEILINSLLRYFTNLLMKSEEKIDYFMFLTAFRDKRAVKLLFGKKLRKHCIRLDLDFAQSESRHVSNNNGQLNLEMEKKKENQKLNIS